MEKAMLNRIRTYFIVGLLMFGIAFFVSTPSYARGVYQTNQDFLLEVFDNDIPKSSVVWLKGDLRRSITTLLGHSYSGLRIRYWQDVERSVWILEEIGKTEPITFGVVVSEQKIEKIKVLAFRESRGDEIRYSAFTVQFSGSTLDDTKLDRHIDGVSGATLSVRAMTSIVKVALYLDNFINK